MRIFPKVTLALLALLAAHVACAQSNITFGTVINKTTKEPVAEASIAIPALRIITSTDGDGKFSFVCEQSGTYDATISTDGINEFAVKITVDIGKTVIPVIEIEGETSIANLQLIDNGSMSLESSASDDGVGMSGGMNVSSILNAARDPFLNAAAFGWGPYFFSLRGLDNEQHEQYINGIPMNDPENGRVDFNAYSGLNDVFRGRTFNLGLQPNDYAFGGYGLNTYVDASASSQRPQTRISYASTNRNYRNRLMLTHSSGLNKKGWAYSFSLSRRWAQAGPIPGTFYDAYGYYAAIEKKYKHHDISLIAFGAPMQRGKNGPTTAEAFSLAGSNYYNPYWGYQNGEVRNSRVFKNHTPLFILSDKWDITDKTRLTASVGYQTGETSTTTFDWYNSADPRPDYYRYLPSWDSIETGNMDLVNQLRALYSSNPNQYLQVNWDRLYQVNYFNNQTGDGRASYILGADVIHTRNLTSNINLQHQVDDHITLNTGVLYQNQRNQNFRRVEDLLGAQYWLNINQFAERDNRPNPGLAQLDLNNPNQKMVVGDRYGYNYDMLLRSAAFFTQAIFKYNRFDFFIAHEIGNTAVSRDGMYLSGLYPTNSFGLSDQVDFNTNRSKAGLTFKINGRNYLYANGAVGTRAPFADNIFISPRTRNQLVERPNVERVRSAEVGYLLRSPNFKTRISGYVTETKDATEINRYYNDNVASFVNMVLRGVNKRSTGIEIGSEIKISPAVTLNLAASVGQAFYTSRANFKEYDDNDTNQQALVSLISEYDTAYIANYHIPKGPQTALSANVFYRSPKYWFGSVNLNYMADKWFDIAPTARSVEGVDGLDPTGEMYRSLLSQRKIPAYFVVGAFAGKSFKLNNYFKKASNDMFLFANLGLSNILNKQDIILYGFENNRTGVADNQDLPAFGDRFAYALGFQYFLNIAFTF